MFINAQEILSYCFSCYTYFYLQHLTFTVADRTRISQTVIVDHHIRLDSKINFPFLPFFLPCPFTSSYFALFFLSFFCLLYLFSSFVHPFPFYQNSHHSISRLEGGDRRQSNLGLVRSVLFVLSVLLS